MEWNESGFEPAFSIDFDPPGVPSPEVWQFSVPGGRSALTECTVRPARRSPWIAKFAPGGSGMSGMFATANPDALCSVLEGDGWWIPVEEPAMAKLFLRAVQKARVLEDQGLLLFETFTDIGAVDANGIRWCTGRIGWDSLQIRAIEGDRIVGTCWDGPSNGDLEFAVDLTDGRVSGGSPHFRR